MQKIDLFLYNDTIQIINKWKQIYPDYNVFINEAIKEFDKYLSLGIKPSDINYDDLINRLNEVLEK